ncbi:hypothetical protein CQ022_13085 [Chryseobacterium culicis]|uniref:Uncharacterized protein n=1 Tax=Chryseobacterium culicis TaxID=680127 RepID=A0A2S9CRC8_CHRCI|nr:hypothetical protein CQ022_13085 [Chryseobacterium culicis]PRB89306.1 hypothetical protein CQ033_11985 [Chryseobacterium culicis]
MPPFLPHLCHIKISDKQIIKTKYKNKFTKLILKSPDKMEENSGLGSRCFSSVFEGSLPKKFRSASFFLTV